VGQNLGAKTPERAARVTWVATAATMALLASVAAVVFAFPAQAMRIFIDDPAVVAEGVLFLRIIAPFWAFFGGVMVIQGGFRGAGDTRVAMALSILSRWVFRVPVAIALAFAWTLTIPGVDITLNGFAIGVEGIWWAFSTGAFLSFLVAVAWFRLGNWQEGVIEESEEPGTGPGPAAADTDGDAEFVDD
ncbi:MATE family efflux transporter, partial [Natronoarchaeum mannanilyticum]